MITVDTNEFFSDQIKEVLNKKENKKQNGHVSKEERVYAGSILRIFANDPICRMTQDAMHNPGLYEVFDHFIILGQMPAEAHRQEKTAAFLLLMTGYFRRQMLRRHSLCIYTVFGREMFAEASKSREMFGRQELLQKTSQKFEMWQDIFQQLHDHFLWSRYDIRFQRSLKPS